MTSLIQAHSHKEDLIVRGYNDPVFFMHTFLPHLFGGDSELSIEPPPMPWIHQGIIAITTRKSDFLWNYGCVSKLMREFAITRGLASGGLEEPPILGYVFRVFEARTGSELTWQEVEEAERNYSPEFLSNRLEIVLTVGRNALFLLPRGFGKTTLVGQGIPIYFFCYKVYDFFVYISETGQHAEMQANNIRSELAGNTLILDVFGSFEPTKSDGKQKWSERLFETNNGVAMAARGRGSQIRGLNHKSRRPSCMLLDDIEDKESVSTPEQRRKTIDWMFGDVVPALPKLNKDATIFALGTRLANECLVTVLAKDPDWSCICFAAVDKEGNALWPENMSLAEIERERQAYQRKGLLYLFYLEYYNKYVSSEIQQFRPEFFKYGVPEPGKVVAYAIYTDPAISERQTADRAVIQVAAMLTDGTVYMAAEWSRQGEPDIVRKMVEAYFTLCLLFRPVYHGFEANAYQKALETLLKDAMPRHNYFFEPIPVVNTISKNLRIAGSLLPRVSAGFVLWHPSFENSKTVSECLCWSPAIKDQADDGPDCASGVIKLLEPLSPYAAKTDPYVDDKEEYPDIDLVMGQDWRSY